MSVDAFGRIFLKSKATTGGGPRGKGYKLTSDGNFDVENRKLCNVADPTQPADAVNLRVLQVFLEAEVSELFQITTSLREEVERLRLELKRLGEQHSLLNNEV